MFKSWRIPSIAILKSLRSKIMRRQRAPTTPSSGRHGPSNKDRLFFRRCLSWVGTSTSNLYKVGLLKPSGIVVALQSIYHHGPNLMVLLDFARRMSPNTVTLNQQYSYQQCYQLALSLASYLHDRLPPQSRLKPRVALLCSNHPSSILALFATARLGADIILLNTDLSLSQINGIIEQHAFEMIICDDEFTSIELPSGLAVTPVIISRSQISDFMTSIFDNLPKYAGKPITAKPSDLSRLPRKPSGKISVLTGGTSGQVKFAKRDPSVLAMLLPFLALLNDVELAKYQSVYIATPIYHGYGLAALIVSVLLSARLFINEKFDTSTVSQLIMSQQIEALILVPTLLKRLLDYGDEQTFASVGCILSGGAKLEPCLVKRTLAQTGDTLFNLYGTSEAGFGVMATPADLRRYPDSIGRAIKGVRWQINAVQQPQQLSTKTYRDADAEQSDLAQKQQPVIDDGIGVLSLCTAWSMDNTPHTLLSLLVKMKSVDSGNRGYISTGDLAYANDERYLFLKGRADDMIVSGGENVYPADIEQALKQHPQIEQVAVLAVDDDEFGKRLVAFVSLRKREQAIAEQLLQWLKSRLARYQMPQRIILLDSLPMTSTGKVSHARLKETLTAP